MNAPTYLFYIYLHLYLRYIIASESIVMKYRSVMYDSPRKRTVVVHAE